MSEKAYETNKRCTVSDSKYTHGRAAHNAESLSALLSCLSQSTCSANISYFGWLLACIQLQ